MIVGCTKCNNLIFIVLFYFWFLYLFKNSKGCKKLNAVQVMIVKKVKVVNMENGCISMN